MGKNGRFVEKILLRGHSRLKTRSFTHQSMQNKISNLNLYSKLISPNASWRKFIFVDWYSCCMCLTNGWVIKPRFIKFVAWLVTHEVIFAVYFLNTLIFYHNLDGMQQIRESYKKLCKNQKFRLKRQLSSGGYNIIHSPLTIIMETLNSHFHTNTFEKKLILNSSHVCSTH